MRLVEYKKIQKGGAMKILLTKDQRAVANAASKEIHPKYALKCVHIKKGIIEASNGFLLIQKKIDYDGEEDFLLDAGEFKKLKDSKSMGGVSFSSEGDEIRAIGENTVILRKQSGVYPDSEAFIPKEEPVFKIALSRKLLKKLISTLDDDDAPVRFYFYPKLEPVKISIPEENTTAIIMPINVEL